MTTETATEPIAKIEKAATKTTAAQILPPALDASDELLTVTEAARLLKLANCTIYGYLRSGRLKAFYVGTMRRRIPKSEVLKLLGSGGNGEMGGAETAGGARE